MIFQIGVVCLQAQFISVPNYSCGGTYLQLSELLTLIKLEETQVPHTQEADDTRRKLPSEESELVAPFPAFVTCLTSWTLGPAHLTYHLHWLLGVPPTSLDSFPCWPGLFIHQIPQARLDPGHSWAAVSCSPPRTWERKTPPLADADLLVLHQ